MSDAAGLHHALRAAVTLRDKVVVLSLRTEAFEAPERVENLAVHLSLLRALGLRLIAILNDATPAPAARLAAAISRQGQRPLLLPATGIISAPQPVAGAPALPMLPVTVDPVPLGQLTAIGYIPLVLLPVLTEAGAVVNLGADDVAAAVGLYLDAALLVFVRAGLLDAPPLPLFATGRQTVVTSAESPAGLLSDILLAGFPVSPPISLDPGVPAAKVAAKVAAKAPEKGKKAPRAKV